MSFKAVELVAADGFTPQVAPHPHMRNRQTLRIADYCSDSETFIQNYVNHT